MAEIKTVLLYQHPLPTLPLGEGGGGADLN